MGVPYKKVEVLKKKKNENEGQVSLTYEPVVISMRNILYYRFDV